jgi:hypothetical protein
MSQITLREQLEAAFDKHDVPDTPEPIVEAAAEPIVETPEAERVRDYHGKFAKAEEKPIESQAITPEPIVAAIPEVKPIQRPTTWKKDYLPVWDKLAAGLPLDAQEAKKLAEYTNQRENEFKSGVSTYKAEADSAKELKDAIAPYIPELQQHNIKPVDMVKNLFNAHRMLSMGSAEQKLNMFQQLAQSYGIPLNAVSQAQQGQLDPNITALMNELQQVKTGMSEVTGWRQQQEQNEVNKVLSEFQNVDKYPHFEMVRSNMARLLESGTAPDPQTAYAMAAKPIEDLIESRLSQVKVQQPDAIAVAVAAKAKVISNKSSTPRGKAKTPAKDLRGMLEEAYDQHAEQRV